MKSESKKTSCAHCGDNCYDSQFLGTEQSFCCSGCELVYNLLHDNDLSQFYKIDTKAGLSQKGLAKEKYDYLDDIEIQQTLCSYMDDTVCKVWLSLPTIHCTSCLWLLENITRLNDGIQSSNVNYLEKKALFQIKKEDISLRELAALLTQIGYPPQISLHDSDERAIVIDRSIYYKLGIAGFVFGNIMLLSFPDYLGLEEGNTIISSYIHYINLILIIPVIVYCAADYYRSAWIGLKLKHLNIDVPISLGITALFATSVFDIYTGTSPGYLDSLAGLVFFLLIGKWFQSVSYNRIQFDLDYKSYFPLAATLLVDAGEEKVSLNKLAPNNIIRVRHGELIPADGLLLSPVAHIDYSFVTGEKDPMEVTKGDKVYSGGIIEGNMADVRIKKTVDGSYLTQLWNDVSFSDKKSESNISKINAVVSKYFTLSILIIAFSAASYHAIYDMAKAIRVFTTVLIIACPCAVALSIPFTFGNLIRLLAKKNIFFKNTKVVEKCSKVDYLVFDKTGTITNSRNKSIFYHGKHLTDDEEIAIKTITDQSAHNMSRNINNYFSGQPTKEVLDFKELEGQGIIGTVSGRALKIGSRSFFETEKVLEFERLYPSANDSNVYFEIENELCGAFKKASTFINNLAPTLTSLSSRFQLSLISGDNSNDEIALKEQFSNWRSMYFEKTPFEKLGFIKQLQKDQFYVSMIGDGLNDAGALSQSDVGIAVTENTANFTPACDIIFDISNFESFPALFSVSRSAVKIIYFSYAIAFSYNALGLFYAVQGKLTPLVAAILMPLSSITVVTFGLICSTLLIKKSNLNPY